MHRAANYLDGLFPAKVNRTVVESRVLTPADAAAVTAALPEDAGDYYYSACMSLVEGLLAVDSAFYTWSTVKMYYATYYAVRALLAWDNVAVFWPTDQAPYRVRGLAGESPRLMPGRGSHKATLQCFRQLNPGHVLLTQPVDVVGTLNIDGFAWLLNRREDANYAIARFCEPDIPEYFNEILRLGVRQAIAAYLDPAAGVLTFDRDHAIVSFPLAVLRHAGDSAKAIGGAQFHKDEVTFLTKKCRDRRSVLAPLMTFIRGTLA